MLVLTFEICEASGCDKLIFTETTGLYNADTNPNGWGSPNAELADVASVQLTIETNNNTYTFNLSGDGFPTVNCDLEYIISPTDLNQSNAISDGVYEFTYTVTMNNGDIYTQNITQSFYCQVECCVNSMLKNIDFSCDCSQPQIEEYFKAKVLLYGLEANSNCGCIDNFNNTLEILQKICKNKNCKTC